MKRGDDDAFAFFTGLCFDAVVGGGGASETKKKLGKHKHNCILTWAIYKKKINNKILPDNLPYLVFTETFFFFYLPKILLNSS